MSLCLFASACYSWKAVDNPTAVRRELSRTVRITNATGEQVEMVFGRATDRGVEFRSGELVAWDNITRLEERRLSKLRTAGAVVGGYVLFAGVMGFFISGPEAIGLDQ